MGLYFKNSFRYIISSYYIAALKCFITLQIPNTCHFIHSFRLPFAVKVEKSVDVAGYDGIIFISAAKPGSEGPAPIQSAIAKAYKVKNISFVII